MMETQVRISSDRRWMDALVCPDCRRPLQQGSAELSCLSCARSWSVVDGVPQFVSGFRYRGEIPQEKMQAVNQRAASGSWRSALLDSATGTSRELRK